jgi:hypothetical protein
MIGKYKDKIKRGKRQGQILAQAEGSPKIEDHLQCQYINNNIPNLYHIFTEVTNEKVNTLLAHRFVSLSHA